MCFNISSLNSRSSSASREVDFDAFVLLSLLFARGLRFVFNISFDLHIVRTQFDGLIEGVCECVAECGLKEGPGLVILSSDLVKFV